MGRLVFAPYRLPDTHFRLRLVFAPYGIASLKLDNFFAFTATNLLIVGRDGRHGRELWRANGTVEGIILVEDIRPGASGSIPQNFASLGSTQRVMFAASHDTWGLEPWYFDEFTSAPIFMGDISAGSASSNPRNFILVGEYIFFVADDNEHGNELWAMPASVIH